MVKRLYKYPYLVDYFDKADTLYLWDKNKIGSTVTADYLIQLPSNVYNGENSGLDKGTYRVKTVFTVTDKNGKEETIPLYSTTEKVS